MSWFWWFVVVVGPILLFVLIIWGVVRTRTSSKDIGRAERGARELRDELAREDENQGAEP